jgi:hypothetical protein
MTVFIASQQPQASKQPATNNTNTKHANPPKLDGWINAPGRSMLVPGGVCSRCFSRLGRLAACSYLAKTGSRCEQAAVLAVGHAKYPHMTVLPEDARAALAGDFS